MRILKYAFREKVTTLQVPVGSVVLSVAVQNNVPYVWVQLAGGMDLETRVVTVVLAGEQFSEDVGRFVGTVLLDEGRTVEHIFERLV